MKKMVYISYLLIMVLQLISCQKEDIEPVGFFEANYYTAPDSAQSFYYYFDDGEFVAGGLDEYMVTFHSEAGTFNAEQLLLLKLRSRFEELPDSIVPWTYFMGLNYSDSINKEVTVDFNVQYPYNNFAHSSFSNERFFSENINQMRLLKVKYTDPPGLYYNPEYEISFVSHDYDDLNQRISFKTDEADALYALCWVEKPFQDTINFQVNSGGGINDQTVVQYGFRNESQLEGAVFEAPFLTIDYTPKSSWSETNTDEDGWRFEELHMTIQNPQEGIIDAANIQMELIISIKTSATGKSATRLLLTNNSNLEIITWPSEPGGFGELNISGFMEKEYDQTMTNVDFNLKFRRLR